MSPNTITNLNLTRLHCKQSTSHTPLLTHEEIKTLLQQVDGWEHFGNTIYKKFIFGNFKESMKFVHAIEALTNKEDHHPELTITYDICRVSYTTYSIIGLSLNDFICAAKVDALIKI